MSQRVIEYFLLASIVITAFLIRTHQLQSPLADWHSFRQADTASVAREFTKQGIDLLHPKYHDLSNIQSGQDNPQGYRMVEFPLVNALVAIIHPLLEPLTGFELHVHYRLVSIFFSLISLVLIFYLTKYFVNGRVGLLAAAVFAFLPYNIYYSRAILPEVPMVTMSLLTLVATLKLIANPDKSQSIRFCWWCVLIVSAAVALLIKPTAIFMLLPAGIIVLEKKGLGEIKNVHWLVAAVIACIPLILWRQWIQAFPEGIASATWLLNGDGIRFKPAWVRWLAAERISALVLGYWGLALFVTGLVSKQKTVFFTFWLLSSLLYLVVFATGNVRHDYYQIPLIPIISIFVAMGIYHLHRLKTITSYAVLIASILFMVGFGWYQVEPYFSINNPAIVAAGNAVDKLTPPDALVIAPYMGDTAFLYQTNRRGWPLGFDIEDKVNKGAQYYVSTSYDDEARELEQKYEVLEKTNDYLIIKLQ